MKGSMLRIRNRGTESLPGGAVTCIKVTTWLIYVKGTVRCTGTTAVTIRENGGEELKRAKELLGRQIMVCKRVDSAITCSLNFSNKSNK